VPSRAGHEATVEPAGESTNPWSHGLAMALVWTSLFGSVAGRVSRRRGTGLLVGSLVFSHWLVDFVSKPMTGVFPRDTGLPLWFEGSPTVGLGPYRSRRVANAVEYGSLAVGAAPYLQTVARGRGQRAGAEPSALHAAVDDERQDPAGERQPGRQVGYRVAIGLQSAAPEAGLERPKPLHTSVK